MDQRFYCYKITNLVNGKIYIGKAIDVDERWRKHKTAATRRDPNDYSYLHRAMNSYGFDTFKVETIGEFLTEEESLSAEVEFIKQYKSNDRNIGYNLTDGGEGSSGFRHTPESRQKMRQTKRSMNLNGENNSFYGKHHTAETKQKLSDSHIEYFKNHEHPFTGKRHSDESKKKMSSAATGRKMKPEVAQKLSEDRKGDISFITSAKLSEADVIEIKKLLVRADITHKEIAKIFGVSRATITYISVGKTWSHIKI